ncbi:MAG: hypothetical protein ACK41O_02955 [Runella zeae]
MNYYKFGRALEQIKKNGKPGRLYPWAYVKGDAEHFFINEGVNGIRIYEYALTDNVPVLDHFYLRESVRNKINDWILLDLYGLSAINIQGSAYLVSPKLRDLIEQFEISQPYRFYPAKLLYQGEKLDYFLFQFGSFTHPNYAESSYKFKQKEVFFKGDSLDILEEMDFLKKANKCYAEGDMMTYAKMVFDNQYDLFITYQCKLISARMKEALEQANISGIWYQELKDFTVGFLNPLF